MTTCLNCHHQNPKKATQCQACGAPLPLSESTTLRGRSNRYRVTRVLGHGGFGITYLAEGLPMGRSVVVKELRAEYMHDTKVRELFKREAQVLTRLDPAQGVPAVLDYFYYGKNHRVYLVMEYIEGETLEEYLQRREQLPEEEVVVLALLALQVLVYLHGRGVIHRDVKPGNIMLRPDGGVVLIDFGAVKEAAGTRVEAGRVTSTMIATRGYAPPEQMRCLSVDQTADLFALGATLIHLLTGIYPNELINPKTGDFEWHDRVQVEEGLARVIEKATAYRPIDRYQSAEEMSQSLEAVVAKFPVKQVYDLGDYEFITTLSSGVAGTVYKAVSKQDGQMVTVRVLRHPDSYFTRRFWADRGLELYVMLRHPHILRVYGYGPHELRVHGFVDDRDLLYIVTEFVDGDTLRNHLHLGRPLSLERVIAVVGQVCDALQYAHQKGIYHRTIEPKNILLCPSGYVKLDGFMDVHLHQLAQGSNWLIGLPSEGPCYRSYEDVKGYGIDGRSDLYSLGAVLYEMVTGHKPFSDKLSTVKNPLAVVDMLINDHPTPPRQLNPALPEWVEGVVLRALDKDRDQRFQTAEEMARALGYTQPMHGGAMSKYLRVFGNYFVAGLPDDEALD